MVKDDSNALVFMKQTKFNYWYIKCFTIKHTILIKAQYKRFIEGSIHVEVEVNNGMCTVTISASFPEVFSHLVLLTMVKVSLTLKFQWSCWLVHILYITGEPPAAFLPQSAAFLWVYQQPLLCSSPRCQFSPSPRTILVSLLQKHNVCYGVKENFQNKINCYKYQIKVFFCKRQNCWKMTHARLHLQTIREDSFKITHKN